MLAIVAYQQPITADQVSHQRGKPSSHVLTHLVRRGLPRIERPGPRAPAGQYFTTNRFLKLFNLQSLDDLPAAKTPAVRLRKCKVRKRRVGRAQWHEASVMV